MKTRNLWKSFIVPALLLTACSLQQAQPTQPPTPTVDSHPGLSDDQAATLGSLEQVDDHPLYIMHYVGPYLTQASSL